MAAIRERVRKDGVKVYNAQVRMDGFPSRSASFRSRRAAERWAKTVEAEMIEGRHFRNVEARRRSLADAIDRYLRDELPKKRDPTMHRTTLRWWREEIGHLKLADVTPAVIAECRDKLARGTYERARPGARFSKIDANEVRQYSRKPGTVNRYLECLGHLFTVARKEWHWITLSPMKSVSKLDPGKASVRALSDEERAALLAEIAHDPTLETFVLLALTTACRAGELTKLRWSDVDLKAGRLLFRETKNAEPRTAWVHGGALERLRSHAKVRRLKGGLVFTNSKGGTYGYHGRFTAARKRAGIEAFRFHDLRHTAATYLAQMGATEQQLRAIGGWKSNVVRAYVHLAAEDAREATAALAARIDAKPERDQGGD